MISRAAGVSRLSRVSPLPSLPMALTHPTSTSGAGELGPVGRSATCCTFQRAVPLGSVVRWSTRTRLPARSSPATAPPSSGADRILSLSRATYTPLPPGLRPPGLPPEVALVAALRAGGAGSEGRGCASGDAAGCRAAGGVVDRAFGSVGGGPTRCGDGACVGACGRPGLPVVADVSVAFAAGAVVPICGRSVGSAHERARCWICPSIAMMDASAPGAACSAWGGAAAGDAAAFRGRAAAAESARELAAGRAGDAAAAGVTATAAGAAAAGAAARQVDGCFALARCEGRGGVTLAGRACVALAAVVAEAAQTDGCGRVGCGC